jgi:capsular polysaccharide biosynthesis protein
MSEQQLNLRRSVQIVRRYRILVGVLIVLGLLAGGADATLKPPMLTSQALVVLPQSGANMPTQVVIANSDPVLSGALGHTGARTSLQTLRNDVHASSLTPNVISISATSKNAADAESIANAVANSYVAYVSAATSPVGHVSVRLLQAASTASGLTPVKELILIGLIGALSGLVIGIIVSLARGRNERWLRQRDEIANSIGIPVLASLPVERPSDAPGWTKLLADYEPGPVDAWRLRVALEYLGLGDGGRQANGNSGRNSATSLAVMSLSTDKGALALGPQLASYAAAQGIPTALVVGPQQDANFTAVLRTACAAPLQGASERTRYLRVFTPEDTQSFDGAGAALVVVVVVIDGRDPQITGTVHTKATLLGVTAGAATAEQLARAATAAATDGRPIAGILVADPAPEDQTTGRIPQLPRSVRRMQPTRLKNIPTEIRR